MTTTEKALLTALKAVDVELSKVFFPKDDEGAALTGVASISPETLLTVRRAIADVEPPSPQLWVVEILENQDFPNDPIFPYGLYKGTVRVIRRADDTKG